MADNNLARSRNDLPDFFADDDPLAELARIVGYEDRPVTKQASPFGDDAYSPRREPAFNLEDELLQEFERYDAPRFDPIHDISIDDAPRAVLFAEPEFDDAVETAAEYPPALLPGDRDSRLWLLGALATAGAAGATALGGARRRRSSPPVS